MAGDDERLLQLDIPATLARLDQVERFCDGHDDLLWLRDVLEP